MKNAKKIYDIGQLLLVAGSVLYVAELVTIESSAMTLAITLIYLVSLVLILIGWLGTAEERKAEKEQKKQEAAAKKAAKQAARNAA